MQETIGYESPLGKLMISADEYGLTKLDFGRRNVEKTSLKSIASKQDVALAAADTRNHDEEWESAKEKLEKYPVLRDATHWLDLYFAGKVPGFTPALHLQGTSFQISVWNILKELPYGTLTTYGAIARQVAAKQGRKNMSAQAVGGAVGRNPVGIIVPCHRVVGNGGKLTGFGGGMDRKIQLLRIEGFTVKEAQLSIDLERKL